MLEQLILYSEQLFNSCFCCTYASSRAWD